MCYTGGVSIHTRAYTQLLSVRCSPKSAGAFLCFRDKPPVITREVRGPDFVVRSESSVKVRRPIFLNPQPEDRFSLLPEVIPEAVDDPRPRRQGGHLLDGPDLPHGLKRFSPSMIRTPQNKKPLKSISPSSTQKLSDHRFPIFRHQALPESVPEHDLRCKYRISRQGSFYGCLLPLPNQRYTWLNHLQR